jgi:diadenosine tetraphosphate (Ap4A) HIT family hydrolase
MTEIKKQIVNVGSAFGRPDGNAYAEHLLSIQEEGNCPFCPENLAKNHKRPILIDGQDWVLTENMYPYKHAQAHLLAIHKSHIEHMSELSSEAWNEVREMVVTHLGSTGLLGATFMMRFGETRFNGASVNHLHAQIISGNGEDDGIKVMARVG